MRLLRVALLTFLALAIGCSKKDADTILVGHVTSMTGSEATFGVSTDQGVKLAIEERNKAGGVKGKKLVVKTLDAQGKPEEAQVAATRLVVKDKVTILLGEVASSRSLAVAPVADDHKVPMISSASTNPKVTLDPQGNTRKYIFRVCFIDPFQGTVMAKFARENMKVGKVAVLRDVENAYSVGLADFFTETFKELGGEIVSDQSFKSGDQDFKAQLTKIRRPARGDLHPGLLHRRGADRPPGPRAGDQAAHDRRRRLGLPQAVRDRRRRHGGLLLLQPLHGREPRPAGAGVHRQVQGGLQGPGAGRAGGARLRRRAGGHGRHGAGRTSPARPSPRPWPPPRTSRRSPGPSRSTRSATPSSRRS